MELLLIMFIVLAVASGLGIAFLYLSKNPKTKTIFFYFTAVLSMLIALLNATSQPSNYIMEQLISWAFGFLAVISIIIKVKNPQKTSLANLLVTISILCGLTYLFFF
ncbi:MAG: hypothetical protein E6344_02265 [Clostridium sp.]|uniref:hypothetical protein n=1 Tax=Clostridium culturomicium TaxID=1499683 RepID=UPI00059139A8|nr:hypothetical protein [Clostridium culturomicium]MDU4892097.1 hypothetical protein [Clostridium sp.]MDU7082484.1 hypothetical protein [Clostridium sp.]